MSDTYKLSREVRERIQSERKGILEKTSAPFRGFMETMVSYAKSQDKSAYEEFKKVIRDKKPSDFFRKYDKDLRKLIRPELIEGFYRETDRTIYYQYDTSCYRRSFRSGTYTVCVRLIENVLKEFIDFSLLKVDLCDYISGNLPEDILAFRKNNPSSYAFILAAKIDEGDRSVMDAISDSVLNDGGNVSYALIRGIFLSQSEEMYALMEKLLLAARLQEGVRQAVCENIDVGTKDAFIYMFRVIMDHDLTRFASVQRAIETFAGLLAPEEKGGDRINKKQAALMFAYMMDPKERQKALGSNDHMEIYLALWAIGTDDIEKACEKATELVFSGNREQRLTACFFLEQHYIKTKMYLDIFEKYRDDLEVQAVLMPGFLPNIQHALFSSVTVRDGRYTYHTGRVFANVKFYFEDEKEARRAYEILDTCRAQVKKKIEMNGVVFPWHKVSLSKTDYITKMVFCASATMDTSLTLAVAGELSAVDPWCRASSLRLLLNEPCNKEEYEIVTRALADGEGSTRDAADKMLKHELERDTTMLAPEISAPAGKLPKMSYVILEDMLRLKKADLRQNVIAFLNTMDDGDKVDMIGRLLGDKSEEKRVAALDILLQMKKEESPAFAEAAEKTKVLTSPTSKEQILLDEIHVSSEETPSGKEEGFSFFDPSAEYEPVFDMKEVKECQEVWEKLFPNRKLGKKLPSLPKKSEEQRVFQALDDLIEANKDTEYDFGGEKRLLGDGVRRYFGRENGMPCPELWEKFYGEHIKTEEELLRLRLLLYKLRLLPRSNIKGYDEYCKKYVELFFGPEFTSFDRSKYKYQSSFDVIISFLHERHKTSEIITKIGCALCYEIANSDDPMLFTFKRTDIGENTRVNIEKDTYVRTPLTDQAFLFFLDGMGIRSGNFPYKYALLRKFDGNYRKDDILYDYGYQSGAKPKKMNMPSISEYISACARGVISKDFMYKRIFDGFVGEALSLLSNVIIFIRESNDKKSTRGKTWGDAINRMVIDLLGRGNYREKVDPESLTKEDKKILSLVEECYETVLPLCVDRELRRGDMPTEYSPYMHNIKRIYGLDFFVRILMSLGKDTFVRSKYISYSRDDSKATVLSQLLGVCVPDDREGDVATQGEKLKKMVKGTDIKEKRLIEAALFSPEWLDIVGEVLKIDGFKSGCYYFMAHMNEEFDDKRKASIAKYSPISPEEFNNGAFDKGWFEEVYATLGPKNFDVIYDAAKYISDGAKHARARKYADAATGKLDPEKTREEIIKKRNKDLLMAYAILDGTDEELRGRYSYIRQFIKESKAYGAQRRASEKLAGETAIKNMATAQGYPDETRFILKMENDIASELSSYWKLQQIDDVGMCLVVESGKVEIHIEKAGKELKSLPAKLKKDERVLDLQEAKKTFTEQFRRTKIMLEEAMESKTAFTASEIDAMRSNPVLTDMIGSLVFESDGKFGLWGELPVKKDAEVFVAHSYSLFKAGVWKEMQSLIFEKEIAQPFKQVFRELYVKTDEEREAYQSRRYAGNQIQTQRTVGVLKNRRWIADVEEGLQKVYYKENIIATIYALADWFSPSEVEAPTLEWVAFLDRKTGQEVKIADVPDILFSEVMRDVDLAVSVAHAGQVDPEMSHSTIEMRRAVAEFSCRSFKLSNVTFTESHAKIKGTRGNYSVHLGSGVIHLEGGLMINVLPVHSQRRGRIFLPFVDDDPKTAEIISKILLFAEDQKIKDPFILEQIE
ncbi:MAG: DUF4132 domain-containing protein [Clostridiales bacterium]|nr:DUF4132 domain-containing protein [Clostridiales bacterium]